MGRIKEKERGVRGKKYRQRKSKIFLVCEGKETEITYFKHFQQRYCDIQVIPIESHYKDAVKLVKNAENTIKKKESADYSFNDGDRIYCIFDRDANSDNDLREAEKTAQINGYFIAYSNPCVELWYLYHFIDQRAELENAQAVIKALTQKGRLESYTKNRDVYDILKPLQDKAIERANNRLAVLIKEKTEIVSRKSNPATTISELVEFLNGKIADAKAKISK